VHLPVDRRVRAAAGAASMYKGADFGGDAVRRRDWLDGAGWLPTSTAQIGLPGAAAAGTMPGLAAIGARQARHPR